jgi:type I restriction enzyme, R subunit
MKERSIKQDHGLSENSLELEAIKKTLELGNYQSFNGLDEKLGSDGTFGRKTTEEVILPLNLKKSLQKLNPNLPNEAIDNAFYELIEGKSALNLAKANQFFYKLIKDGVVVSFKDNNGIEKQEAVKIIDWNDAKNNEFLIIQQFKVSGEIYNRRPDLIIFINGLPLVLIELKASHKNLINAFKDNITDYKNSVPQLFWYNALIVASNGSESKIGSVTSSWEHFSEWKKINDEGEKGIISLDTIIKGVFAPSRLLDIIENFILFMEGKGGLTKIIARNHQYLGVNNTIESVKNRKQLKGKLGVLWHTQGSGKSFSMVFFTQKILRKLQGNWTFLIVTDREDLDRQIYKNFANSGAVTEKGVRATSRVSLKKLLSEDHRNIFTMIQKFSTKEKGEVFEELSNREDVIVITDEAHRSQYNVLAMNMRKALPNASFIAFTGTPLMKGDEKTKDVFGEYVSIYNFKQSVEDGATVKLYYENRIPELQIINENLDDDIDKIIKDADLTDEQEERFSKTYVKTYELITRNDRLEKIGKDVVDHFMNRGFMGKAMYIAIDKATAVKMYDKVKKYWKIYIEDLEKQLSSCNPSHKKTIADKIKYMKETDMAVIVSSAQNEEETIGNKGADIRPHRIRMNKETNLDGKFKDPDDKLRIVFVCAMWVTGFDAPSVSTLYLDKILKDHTLMQTIARANRVWKDKPDGMIVDYIGIFGALQKALAVYGDSKIENDDGSPIEDKEELVKMFVDASLNMDVFLKKRNIDIKNIIEEKDNFQKIGLVDVAVEKIVENKKSKEEFFNLTGRLKVLLKAVLPDVIAEKYLKQILVISIISQKITEISHPFTPEEREEEKRKIVELSQKVSDVLDDSISIDDYEIKDSKPFDLSQVNFEELKERFFGGDKQKTTLENLKSAVKKKIKQLMELNPTRESYSDKFEELINSYNSGDIDVEKFFLELVSFSRSLGEEENRHMRENLTQEELVIFDILTNPEPKLSKKEMEAVKEVAKELLETLKSEKLVIDWKKKQSTRAKVVNTIEEVCDKLPETYDSGIFKNKCDSLYVYFYDNYSSSEHKMLCNY